MKVQEIALTMISGDVSRNHRVDEDEESISHLAADIDRDGLINPITVREVEGSYRVVAGHRRVAAVRLLGRARIWAVVRDLDDGAEAGIRMAENLLQKSLSPVEEALAIASWMKEADLGIDEAALKMGRRREWVAGRLEIQGYHPAVMGFLHEASITLGVARALALVDDEPRLLQMLEYVVRTGANTGTVEQWVGQWRLEKDSERYQPGAVTQADQRYAPVVPMTTCAVCSESVRLSHASQVCLCGGCVSIMQEVGRTVRDGNRGGCADRVEGDGSPAVGV